MRKINPDDIDDINDDIKIEKAIESESGERDEELELLGYPGDCDE